MRKILTAGLAALTLGGSMAAATVPAEAAPQGSHGGGGSFHSSGFHGGGSFHGGYRGGGYGYRGGGYGFGAGLAGFALGAAIAGGPYYGYGYGYGPGYYGYDGYYGGGYYDAGPYSCISHRRVWDRYAGAWVIRSYRYAC